MTRLLTLGLCAAGIVCAIAACGGGGDSATTVAPAADKLTIVGAGN